MRRHTPRDENYTTICVARQDRPYRARRGAVRAHHRENRGRADTVGIARCGPTNQLGGLGDRQRGQRQGEQCDCRVHYLWHDVLRHITCRVIVRLMLKTFHGKETEHVSQGRHSRRLPQNIQELARRKLRMLNNTHCLNDLRIPPANRLERLRGERSDHYSIRINEQWRVCFVWRTGNAFDVEIVDYH
jgi:proteic killer suppression protein